MDKKNVKQFKNDDLDELEIRLRTAISRHRDYLHTLTVDEEIAKEKFISQLKEQVAACDEVSVYDAAVPKFIKLASIDVDRKCLIGIFKSLHGESGLHRFFNNILGNRSIEDVFDGGDRRFVTKTHVTLAHFNDVPQADFHKKFDHLKDLRVYLSVIALYWNMDNAALEVNVEQMTTCGKELPPPDNAFRHITIWVADHSSAVKSNRLPAQLENGQACKYVFNKPFSVEGTISLWYK